jgi:hypothetical protein
MKIGSSYPSFTPLVAGLVTGIAAGRHERFFKRASMKTHATSSNLEVEPSPLPPPPRNKWTKTLLKTPKRTPN